MMGTSVVVYVPHILTLFLAARAAKKLSWEGIFSYQAWSSLIWKTLKPSTRSRLEDSGKGINTLSVQGGLKAILTSATLPLVPVLLIQFGKNLGYSA